MTRCQLALFVLVGGLSRELLAQEKSSGLPKDLVAAWRNQGFSFGWLRTNAPEMLGQKGFRYGLPLGEGEPKEGELPALILIVAADKMSLTALPVPEQPFGLVFFGRSVTAANLDGLVRLPLERIDLDRAGVTDAGLKHLAEIKTLKILTIYSAHVTQQGASELRKALPKLDLSYASAKIMP